MRFGEFTENWIKKRFYEIADFYKGCGISKEQLTLEGNECILYGELYTTYDTETIEEIKSKTNMESKGLFFSKKNDVIIPASGETPIDIATACCVCKDNVLLGGDLNVIRLKYNNGSFISCQLNGKRKIDIAKIAQGASIVHLHNDDLMKLVLYIPTTLEEQLKIVKLFTLIDNRIKTQSKIIKNFESLICSLRNIIFSNNKWKWIRLDKLVESKIIELKRGNIIPKHTKDSEYCYPVYSSSVHNNGLMGYHNTFMFDKELITWSVDGGGDFFYRNKHKFNVTNVCGIMETTNKYDYLFLYEILKHQHQKLLFDYQTKAHPSVIIKLYYLPKVEISNQKSIAKIFKMYYEKLQKEKDILELYKKQKAYLLQNMFI